MSLKLSILIGFEFYKILIKSVHIILIQIIKSKTYKYPKRSKLLKVK